MLSYCYVVSYQFIVFVRKTLLFLPPFRGLSGARRGRRRGGGRPRTGLRGSERSLGRGARRLRSPMTRAVRFVVEISTEKTQQAVRWYTWRMKNQVTSFHLAIPDVAILGSFLPSFLTTCRKETCVSYRLPRFRKRLPCYHSAETAMQPLIWCLRSLSAQESSLEERLARAQPIGIRGAF